MKYLLLFIIAGLFMLVNTMAFEDEVEDHKFYCEMVEQGAHPDYKGIYNEVCK